MNEFGVDTVAAVNAAVVAGSRYGIFRQGWFGYSDMGTSAYLNRTTWYSYDAPYQPNMTAFQNAGKPAGTYFFSHAWNDASARHEAHVCFQRNQALGITPDWPLFLDWEDTGGSAGSYQALIDIGITPTPALIRTIFEAWCDEVQQLGCRPGFYTNQWIAASLLGTSWIDAKRNSGWWYWNAEWGVSAPWHSCDIWQRYNDTPFEGVNVDWNYVCDDRVWNDSSNIPIWLKIYLSNRGDQKNGKRTILL